MSDELLEALKEWADSLEMVDDTLPTEDALGLRDYDALKKEYRKQGRALVTNE